MGRTSKDLDKKLILIGQAFIQERGVAAISLREVAKVAEVNLGMLNYYFKGKDDFILRCLNELYIPFLNDLSTINNAENTEEQFEVFLFKLAIFARDNRKMILSILKDSLSSDKVVSDFIKSNFSKHFKLMQDKLSLFLKIDSNNIHQRKKAFQLVVSLIGFPSLINAYTENFSSQISHESDEQVKERVKLAVEILKKI